MDQKTPTPTPSELTQQYHSILNSLIEGIQIIDFGHRYLYLNDAAVKQNKQSREELIGHTQMERYPGIEKKEVFAKIDECAKKHIPTSIENEFEFPDGSKGWYEVRSEPLPYGVLILSLDITDKKMYLEAIKREKMESVLANEKTQQSEKMNKLMVDRELVMIDLKKKVKQLEAELSDLQNKN